MEKEKGITLVELLAAMTILFIISLPVLSLLTNSFKGKDTVLNREQLNREANIILGNLEKHFYTYDQFAVKWEKETLYMAVDPSTGNWTALNEKPIRLTDISIGVRRQGEEIDPMNPGIPKIINTKGEEGASLSYQVILEFAYERNPSQTITIETVLKRY